MNCQRFEDVVNDIAREQIIDAAVRSAAVRHSAGCRPCLERLELERDVTVRLRALAGSLGNVGASIDVEVRLVNAFDEVRLIQPNAQVSARRYRSRYLIGSIAAMFLIVLGASAVRWRHVVPVTPEPGPALTAVADKGKGPQAIVASRPDIPIAVKIDSLDSIERRVKVSKASKVHKALPIVSQQQVDTANEEIATDFLPLSYGARSNLAEGGRMVRVELPHSALAALGLPVNMDRANEIVKADVLLGVDGLAHAIRFVR
jgi:hypothetical protein